jgi:hypothetical protein
MTSDAKSEKKELRYIFFDFEASTQFKPDPEVMKFLHQVKFITFFPQKKISLGKLRLRLCDLFPLYSGRHMGQATD